MKNYKLQNSVLSFYGVVEAFEAYREDDNRQGLVLRFPSLQNAGSAQRVAESYVALLRNEPQVLPIWEISADTENVGGFYAVYEWDHSLTPLSDIAPERRELWIMRGAARILESFYRRRIFGQFLGEQAIFVDEKNYSVRLAFIGLAEIFDTCEAGPWEKGAERDYRDDIYHLAKCFENKIWEADECPEIIRDCLAEDKKARPRYPQLLSEAESSPLFHPRYEMETPLISKADNADELVAHLNSTDCYVSAWKENEHNGKKQRECKFQTKKFAGTFVNRENQKYFFIPYFTFSSSYETPKGMILRTRFCLLQKLPRGKEEGYHHLAELGGIKADTIEEWRVVPEQEKEFIEENIFKAEYLHCRKIPSDINKFSFLLSIGGKFDWEKVNKLKLDKKQLEIVPMRATRKKKDFNVPQTGRIDDFTEERLIIEVKIDKEVCEIPTQGDLLIGGSQGEIFSYGYFWRQGDLLTFVAKDSGSGDLRKRFGKILESDSISVSLKGGFGEFGFLRGVPLLLREIVTCDSDHEYLEIPPSGELWEDVSREIIPFKRQTEAVDMFEQGNVVEDTLCGILATPSEHSPSLVPSLSEKQYFFDEKLNESQKSAVWYALRQKPLFLIQGPPGTGKTTVIVELIRQILAENSRARILVCSQMNLAVDNVLERLPEDEGDGHARIRKIRLASDFSADKVTPGVRPYLVKEKIYSWVQSVIERGEGFCDKMPASERKHKINGIIKKWHAFLRDPKNKDCQIRGNVQGDWLPFETAFLKSMNVLGSTCVHIASSGYRGLFVDAFDYLIMDEASKATPAETLIPSLRAKHIILIGDHKQLPPFVTKEPKVRLKVEEKLDEGIEDLGKRFGESLFEKLISEEKLNHCQEMLDTQRRMPKQIGDLISKYFYKDKLQSPNDEEYAREKQFGLPLKRNTSLVFINTAKKENPHDNGRATWRQNSCNVDVVVETLRCLNERLQQKDIRVNVGVIAGYKGQVDLLRKQIKGEKFPFLETEGRVDVNTVDGFQGRENTVIIYDTVRSSAGKSSIGFLDEPRRLNVALSRAQKLLLIVGNADYLIHRAQPGEDNPNPDAERPILGDIVWEISEQNDVFESLEEALSNE